MKLVDKIPLPNNLVLEIWDESRVIAADTTKVVLTARASIGLKPEYFPQQEQFMITRNAFGTELIYEYKKERTFVNTPDKEEVFKQLLEEFKENTLPYLSRPQFPSGFAIAKFMEIKKNPHKFGNPAGLKN